MQFSFMDRFIRIWKLHRLVTLLLFVRCWKMFLWIIITIIRIMKERRNDTNIIIIFHFRSYHRISEKYNFIRPFKITRHHFYYIIIIDHVSSYHWKFSLPSLFWNHTDIYYVIIFTYYYVIIFTVQMWTSIL